ncbi:hypothetical protein F383_33686 [Gossypium arboreum]|uniref:Uncharacterized protein n=1 Tax=Gossypium arboreum TaxID=29729 RepID=A0A0B0PP61_GOSAR|nr:hypothetical protein F383_33686 [Gossypium arboreum]
MCCRKGFSPTGNLLISNVGRI